jgi:hypothetical protein
MKYGTRAALQGAVRKTVEVEVPELGASFLLREMSGTERDKFEAGAITTKMSEDGKTSVRELNTLYLRARLVSMCLVGDDGVRLYADDEVEQLSDGVPAAIIAKLFIKAQELNGLDGMAAENAAKNSESAATGASGSA